MIKRRTSKVLDILSSVGGLMKLLTIVVGTFVASFTASNYFNILSSKIYTWNLPESYKTEKEKISKHGNYFFE